MKKLLLFIIKNKGSCLDKVTGDHIYCQPDVCPIYPFCQGEYKLQHLRYQEAIRMFTTKYPNDTTSLFEVTL